MEIGLDDAYSLSSPDDNRKLYAKWAATYESDFVKKQGYEHPKVIAEIFNREIPVVQKVIDVGTGTGLVGFHLKNLRNIILDGIDISPEMLAEAKLKNVYRNLYERDLTKPIEKVDAPYDALICIGIFTHGHLGPEALSHLIPLIKKGGYFVIGANQKYFIERDFERHFEILFNSGEIAAPRFENVQVYSIDSEHRESLNVISIFQRN